MSKPLRLIFLVTVFVIFSLLKPTTGRAGNEGAHSGDWTAVEFVRRGHELPKALLENPNNRKLLTKLEAEKPGVVEALLRAIDDTPVNSVDEILFDSQTKDPVDALTVIDVESKNGRAIRLQRARWERLIVNSSDLHHLVLHEYLWVIGVDDQNYRLSGDLKMVTSHDALAGTTWVSVTSGKGAVAGRYVTFDHFGGYRTVARLITPADPSINFGMQNYGQYELVAGKVQLTRLGGSCPVDLKELSVNESSMRYDGSHLVIEANNGSGSIFLTKSVGPSTHFNGFIKWGCLSSEGTFTPFSADVAVGDPVPALANDLYIGVPGDKFQAIAYSYRTRKYGQAWNWPTAKEAALRATAICQAPDCMVVRIAHNECIAQAVSDVVLRGWAAAHVQRSSAEAGALQACNRSHNNSCRLVISTCPEP